MAQLYDHRNRPWTPDPPAPSARPQGNPLGDLVDLATDIRDDGDRMSISKDTIRRWKEEQARSLAVSRVPSTPTFLPRDASGLGVSRGIGRWPHFTFEILRELRERAPILQVIHKAREHQTRRMSQRWSGKKGDVGWEVVHKNHHRRNLKTPDEVKPYIERFTQMLESPSKDYKCRTTSTLMSKLMDDLLTINRPVIEPIYSAVDKRRIVQFRAIDGGIIWETLLWVERWIADNPAGFRGWDPRQMSPEDQIDLVSSAIDWDLNGIEYVCVQDGSVVNAYRGRDLIVAPIENRTDVRWVGYPPSNVEMAIHMVASFIATFDYNANYFTKGMLAEFILGVPGDMHPADVSAFVDMLRAMTTGVANAWLPPVLPIHGDKQIQKIDLKQSNREMMYEVWMSLLIALCTAIYRMDPSVINAKPWAGGQGSHLSEPSRENEIRLAHEEGLQGDIGHITENMLNELAQRCHPDIRVRFEYGGQNAKEDADIYEIRSRTDLSLNEVRLQQGEEPWGFYLTPSQYNEASPEDQARHDKNNWNWTRDPGFVSTMTGREQQQIQQQQHDEMMEQMKQQGAPPPDDGFGGRDDGFGSSQGKPPAGGGFGRPPGQPSSAPDLKKATPDRVTVFVQEIP